MNPLTLLTPGGLVASSDSTAQYTCAQPDGFTHADTEKLSSLLSTGWALA